MHLLRAQTLKTVFYGLRPKGVHFVSKMHTKPQKVHFLQGTAQMAPGARGRVTPLFEGGILGPKSPKTSLALGIWVDFGPKIGFPADFAKSSLKLALSQKAAGKPFLNEIAQNLAPLGIWVDFAQKERKSAKCSLRSLFGDFR